jgi:hypothetical protein
MEEIAISVLSIIVSYFYLKYAPMNDIRGAIYYAEHIANQKHKNESVGNTTK